MRYLVAVVFLIMTSWANAQQFETAQCSRSERGKIRSAMRWLLDTMPRYERHLTKAVLANWPGQSRARFVERLKKRSIKFRCVNEGDLCQAANGKYGISYRNKLLPVIHRSPIVICTSDVVTVEEYALVIGHELGHLVWVNAHQRECAKKCLKPRLSRSIELAILSEYSQADYDPTPCLIECGESLPVSAVNSFEESEQPAGGSPEETPTPSPQGP